MFAPTGSDLSRLLAVGSNPLLADRDRSSAPQDEIHPRSEVLV